MPSPKEQARSHRFLGANNYLSKFCPLLSTVTQPLQNLAKDDVQFVWSGKHQHDFGEAKALTTSALCLAYYVTLPVILQLDTSDHRLGAALLQPHKHHDSNTLDESCLQHMAYSSKRVTSTKQHYALVEKECLAIDQAFNKCDQ